MLERLLVLSAVLFCIGLYGVLSRRHIIAVLMALELMFNAVNIALVAFSRYVEPAGLAGPGGVVENARYLLTGQSFAVFVIVAAAAEVALGLALVIALIRRTDTLDITDVSLMRR